MTAEPDRVRLAMAIHEAGHAIAHVLLGGTCRGISIEMNADPGARRGVCFFDVAGDELPLPSPVQVCFQMPTSARIQLERELAATLAGPVAQAVYAPLPPTFELGARDEERVREVIERRHAVLEESASNLLDAEDQFTNVRVSDAERAYELSAWAGAGGADLHLQWLSYEVSLWVRTEEFRRPLAAVSRALVAVGELDGGVVRRLISKANQTSTVLEREDDLNAA